MLVRWPTQPGPNPARSAAAHSPPRTGQSVTDPCTSPECIKAAFGAEKYERLAQIESEYDPGNVFAGNQNIRPKVSA